MPVMYNDYLLGKSDSKFLLERKFECEMKRKSKSRRKYTS